jgi:hypothetical protein
MEKEFARKIVEMEFRHEARLNQALFLVRDQCTEDEFKRYRRAVGHVMGDMMYDVSRHIFREHPDLEPEWLKSERKKEEKAP